MPAQPQPSAQSQPQNQRQPKPEPQPEVSESLDKPRTTVRQPSQPQQTDPSLTHLPRWIHPTVSDRGRSRGLVEAIRFLDLGETERAAVQLQQVRSAAEFGSEVAALHAWALAETGEVKAAETVARDGIATYGATAALGYVMAVVYEMQERPAEAFPLYRDLATLAPDDTSMLRACARTAVAARRGADALPYLERLMLTEPLGMQDKILRAEALRLGGREEDALALYRQMVLTWPQDYQLLADVAEATFLIARSSARPEHHEQALELLRRLTEADPQRATAFRQMGQSAAALHLNEVAADALRRCLELEPGNVEAGLELGSLLAQEGDPQAAADVLLDLLRQPLNGKDVEAVQSALLELR